MELGVGSCYLLEQLRAHVKASELNSSQQLVWPWRGPPENQDEEGMQGVEREREREGERHPRV